MPESTYLGTPSRISDHSRHIAEPCSVSASISPENETLLRQTLYQTLHDPYLTNTNGNCRLDSLPILQAVNLFQPGILSVPVDEKGKPTFSLAELAPANGFPHDNAHDAIGDVEATLHLCRLLSERAAGYWSNFVRFAPKAAVLDFIETNEVFSFTASFYGKTHSWMVTALGPNPGYDAQWFVFDLSNDPEAFAALADDDLSKRLTASPKPVRRLRANAGPCILPCEDVPALYARRCPALTNSGAAPRGFAITRVLSSA